MNFIKREILNSFFCGVLCAAWSIFSSFILFYLFEIKLGKTQENINQNFFVIVFFAPIIETLLFNSLPYYLLNKIKINLKYTFIISATILFSLSHLNGFLVLVTLPVGFAFALRYYKISKSKDEFSSTAYTTISHITMNFTVLMLKIFF